MDFQKEKILQDALKDPEITKVIEENKIDKDELDSEVIELFSFMIHKKNCEGCNGLGNCSQAQVGQKPQLVYDGRIITEFVPCKYQQEVIKTNDAKKNLITLACNIDGVDQTTIFKNKPARKEIYALLTDIYNKYMNGVPTKGAFISGRYGCGKSFIMACFAKKYAENGKTVVFAYYPDLVRKLKGSIFDGKVEQIVQLLKEVDVLVLDDFGGETSTPFIRDEVLGAVLQERMENKSLTFITSNLDMPTLHNHLAETREAIDELKASRIEERIKSLMDFITLDDINYR